jgi:hypothetical protein
MSLVFVVLAGWLGYRQIKSSLEKQIQEKLIKAGFTFTYDHMEWHFFPAGVTFANLHLFTTKDSSILSLGLGHADVSYSLSDIWNKQWQQPSRITCTNGYIRLRPDSLQTLKGQGEDMQEDWEIPDLSLRDIDVCTGEKDKTYFHILHLTGSLAGRNKDGEAKIVAMDKPMKAAVDHCAIDHLFDFHGLKADLVEYDMTTDRIQCHNAQIVPLVDRAHLDATMPHVALHADLNIPKIEVSGVEWTFDQKFWLRARKVEMDGLVFNAWQNQEKPLRPGTRPMPPWVDSMAVWFGIDTVQLTNATVTYAFMPAGHPKPAQVKLDKWNMQWLNYGNDTLRPPSFSAEGRIRWMESFWMNGKVTFPYGDPNHSFTMEGWFEPGDFASLNSVLCPTQGFYFEEGHCNQFRFSFTGDKDGIHGKAWVSFDGVRLKLCAEDPGNGTETKTAKTNPKQQEEVRKGKRKKDQDVREGNGKKDQDVREGNGKKGKKDRVAKEEKPRNERNPFLGRIPERVVFFAANILVFRTSTHGKVQEVEVNVKHNHQQSVFSLWLRGLAGALRNALVKI